MRTSTKHDEHFMSLALRLAEKARGDTSPNPLVGALVVRNNRIVGRGYHHRTGKPHAEVLALHHAGSKARGATLFLTLEPCCHTNKRTPPCVPLILQAQIRRVVVAMVDPNPQVKGRGIRQLRSQGVQVDVGCLQHKAVQVNEWYIHWIQTGRPFVFLKAGATLDGKIATKRGESQWITGDQARTLVHRWRSQVDAILVGINTILRDDPSLTARRGGRVNGTLFKHQPLRIVLDSRLRIPLHARVLARPTRPKTGPSFGSQTLIVTTTSPPQTRLRRLRSLGVPILTVPSRKGRPSLRACLDQLGTMGLISVMIEGGGELNAAALRAGVVSQVRVFLAPKILGGRQSLNMVGGPSPSKLRLAWPLTEVRSRQIGTDLLIEGRVSPPQAVPQ